MARNVQATQAALTQAQRALASADALRLATLATVNDGVLVTNAEGGITGYNDRFLALWGLPAHVMALDNHFDLLEVLQSQLKDPVAAITRTREVYRHFGDRGMEVLELADGRVFELRTHEQRVDGIVVGHVWAYNDISERAHAEAALRGALKSQERLVDAERAARTEAERACRMKDEFLATLSHELRTPLNAIVGWSQILLSGRAEPAHIQQGLETIARNAKAQARLIDDLLDMSRIVSGKVRLELQELDLPAVIDAAVDAVRPSADLKSIRLRKIIDPVAGPVVGDPSRLQQVLWNLLANAVKFTPANGSVDVTLERVNSHVEVVVSDTGAGIDPQFLPHVFDRFRQADSSTVRTYGGLGLGLSIVRQLVEMHGGSVWARSDGPGRGSRFAMVLPLAPIRLAGVGRDSPPPARAVQQDYAGIGLEGISVLVVEDEPDTRELIRRVLLDCGAQVTTVPSAAEGLHAIQSNKPDILLSDIGMPDKDGYQFIREVRRLPSMNGGKVPAVALTAFARSEDRTQAMLAGFQMHIAKPIEPRELVATVGSLAGRTARLDD
ncbi:hybrid sensor histidine kinase/response regulator [Tahibacter amnicola]|uniref:histidine kinase n=1 Tax=Tahibacter amnicola TaxID=2976241 RepID=A0ABY6BFS6_9GAMM|nr:ATP-binding protein [Tahibacter amnicola]UXI68642.1 ATP-binding protein [Tahibacter amnicola]